MKSEISLGLPFTVLAYLSIILIMLGIVSIMVPFFNSMPNLIWIGVILFIIGLVGATLLIYYFISESRWSR